MKNPDSPHARRESKQDSYDAVVIGAGHNGLIAAAYLARAGLSTLLIEARDTVGGTATSEEFAGCTVNICNCDHLTIRTTPIAEELNLAHHGLRYIDIEPAQINGTWGSDNWWPSFHDAERTIDAIGQLLPHERNNYKKYLADALPIASLILEAANEPPSRRSLLSRVVARKGKGAARLLAWSRKSAAEVLGSYFSSEAILGPAIVEGPMVWGVSPQLKGTGLGAITLALRHAGQVGRPVGGSGSLPEALRKSFLHFGGELLLSTRVSAIVCLENDERVIELATGQEVKAKIVLSACNPHDTFIKWLRNAPPQAQPMIDRWKNTPHGQGYESKIDATFTGDVNYIALNSSVHQSLGLQALPSTFVIAPSVQDIHRGWELMSHGQILDRPAFLVNIPTLGDETLSGTNTHILSLESLFTPYNFTGGWHSDAEPFRWLKTFDTLLSEPLTPRIMQWRAMTPDKYERDFFLPGGHATSFSGGPLATFMSRTPELTQYRTNVKNLYLTGAATFPGAGIWGASGRNAALTVLQDLKINPL
jgi:beta-carotene ketolase (CrtO type)